MYTTQIYMLYMHLYTLNTQKDHSTSILETSLFIYQCTRNDLRLLEFQKSPGGRMPPDPLAAHAHPHIKTQRKGSQHKHIRKQDFFLKMHQKMIWDCYNLKNHLHMYLFTSKKQKKDQSRSTLEK